MATSELSRTNMGSASPSNALQKPVPKVLQKLRISAAQEQPRPKRADFNTTLTAGAASRENLSHTISPRVNPPKIHKIILVGDTPSTPLYAQSRDLANFALRSRSIEMKLLVRAMQQMQDQGTLDVPVWLPRKHWEHVDGVVGTFGVDAEASQLPRADPYSVTVEDRGIGGEANQSQSVAAETGHAHCHSSDSEGRGIEGGRKRTRHWVWASGPPSVEFSLGRCHWDFLMCDAKAMRYDYRAERRWKLWAARRVGKLIGWERLERRSMRGRFAAASGRDGHEDEGFVCASSVPDEPGADTVVRRTLGYRRDVSSIRPMPDGLKRNAAKARADDSCFMDRCEDADWADSGLEND